MAPMVLNMSKKLSLTLSSSRPARCTCRNVVRFFRRPARHPTPDALPHAGTLMACPGTARSERHAQRQRITGVVHVPGSDVLAGCVLIHDRALFGIVEVVHFQAELHVLVERVEDRTVQLSVGIGEYRQLPRNVVVGTVVAIRTDRQQVLAAPVV